MKSGKKSSPRRVRSKAKTNIRVSRKTGLPPGTLVHIGDIYNQEISINVSEIRPDGIISRQITNPDDISSDNLPVKSWIEVCGLNQVDMIERLGKSLNINPLVLEDVLNTEHRPKYEEHAGQLFLTMKAFSLTAARELQIHQISFILGRDYLVSFQENNNPVFDAVKERLNASNGKIRIRGLDYLLYTLIDIIVDNYYMIAESILDQLEELEDSVYDNPGKEMIDKIQIIRKDISALRKSLLPFQESLGKLIKDDPDLIKNELYRYYGDVQDHVIQIIDSIDASRELSSELKEGYLSNLTYRMNQVIKLLTIITTIFIPLSFIAGIYGMNFVNMPELHWKYGYFIILSVMFCIMLGMLIYFRKKKWI